MGYSKEFIKSETLRLYKSLPQDKEERIKRLDVRDRVIELNYAFFGFVASHTFINNTSVTYEDKLQSALMHFCECWWWYQYEAKYRTDLSFGVFFKPRIGEMIERELNEVKYSVRRTLCMKVGEQLGKHWGQVKYEDLAKVNLPVEDMNALKAMFGSLYFADLEQAELYIQAPPLTTEEFYIDDKFNDVETLLKQELVELERPLTDKDLEQMADMYDLDIHELRRTYPVALQHLHEELHRRIDNNPFD